MTQIPQITQALVDAYKPATGEVELVAYFVLNASESKLFSGKISETLGAGLPGHVAPPIIEQIKRDKGLGEIEVGLDILSGVLCGVLSSVVAHLASQQVEV